MIRQILIQIRNWIDALLWKTAKHPTYTFIGNTATNCSGTITLYSTATNTILDCTVSNNNTDGVWLDNYTAGGNQT